MSWHSPRTGRASWRCAANDPGAGNGRDHIGVGLGLAGALG
jgi:hypothetical protein